MEFASGHTKLRVVIVIGQGKAFGGKGIAELVEGFIFTMDFAPVSQLDVDEAFMQRFKEYTGQDLGGTYNTTYASTYASSSSFIFFA